MRTSRHGFPLTRCFQGGWDDAVARMALVEAALNVNQPRHDPHWAWIDKARELGGDVAELQNRLILTLSEGSEHQ